MSTKLINLDTPVIPDPQRIAWLEANGVDPENVPAAQEVVVENNTISFMQFVRGADGSKVLRDDHLGYEKTANSVPLISAPENHGL